MSDDLLDFADERTSSDVPAKPKSAPDQARWKLLIVDDEREVHDVTKLALQDFKFAGRRLSFMHAYSGAEAEELLAKHDDIAVVLLDVVMESDHAGLKVVRYVRETLGNNFVRIILRTGQPGQAPEHQVITEFDINDYKHKTELTREKLFTTIYTSISSYRDLVALDLSRRGLRKIIEASVEIFELQSMDQFAQGVLEQLVALLYIGRDVMVLRADGVAAEKSDNGIQILAGIGGFRDYVGGAAGVVLKGEVLQRIHEALEHKQSHYAEDYIIAFYETASGASNVLYISGPTTLKGADRELIELFCRCAATGQENVRLLNSR